MKNPFENQVSFWAHQQKTSRIPVRDSGKERWSHCPRR